MLQVAPKRAIKNHGFLKNENTAKPDKQRISAVLVAERRGFCLGTAVPIASLMLVAAAKKQSSGLFFYDLFESPKKITYKNKEQQTA